MLLIVASVAGLQAQRGETGRGAANLSGIKGHVVDESGKPVRGAFVTALLPNPSRPYGFEPVSVKLRAETDERGDFVLEVLPGEYYVVVVPRNPALDSAGRPNETGLANTFHPRAERIADAARVRVTLGFASADITLLSAKLSIIAGRVITASGEPARSGVLHLARGDGLFGMFSGVATLSAEGAFRMSGFQPGTYYLQFREGDWPPPRGVEAKVSGATVVMKGANVTDVVVAPIRMVRGTGRVLSSSSLSNLNPSAIRVGAVPVDFNGNPGPQLFGVVRDDLTFEFKTWPAACRIRVDGLPSGWTVAAIRVKDRDITNQAIEFEAGRDVSGIEIELRGPGPR